MLDPIEEELGKPLEEMKPHQLVKYIQTHQRELHGIELSSSPHGDLATLKSFQGDYGPARAAAIIRQLFLKGGGKAKVVREEEILTVRHFSKGLRWWTDKVDIKIQAAARADEDVANEFVFTSEI